MAFIADLKKALNRVLFEQRYRIISDLLSPHIKKEHKVLDIGASEGTLSKRIQDKVGCKIVGVDVRVNPKSFIEVREYDGRHIPFPDNHFDLVMINDTLHHDLDPQAVIQEAKRVTKGKILIKDHYWESSLDHAWLSFGDKLGNEVYGTRVPLNFLTRSEWHTIFSSLELKIVLEKCFRYHWIDPTKQILYILEK